MPRNGSGVYSLPSTYEAVSGEVIEAQQHNDPLEDLQSDANAARPVVAGGTGSATAVGGADNLSTISTNIASATTTDLSTATGTHVTITGTTTIEGFGTEQAGALRYLTFAGVLTLTHNATSLIIPGGANITTAANDKALAKSLGSGNWEILWYTRATDIADFWEPIAEAEPSNAAVVAFTNLSAYRKLRVTGFFRPATDSVRMFLQTSTNNGSSYDAGASDYAWQLDFGADSTATATRDTADNGMACSIATVGNATNEGVSFFIELDQFNQSFHTYINGSFTAANDSGLMFCGTVGGKRVDQNACNAFQLKFGSGNISTGYAVLEGVRS